MESILRDPLQGRFDSAQRHEPFASAAGLGGGGRSGPGTLHEPLHRGEHAPGSQYLSIELFCLLMFIRLSHHL